MISTGSYVLTHFPPDEIGICNSRLTCLHSVMFANRRKDLLFCCSVCVFQKVHSPDFPQLTQAMLFFPSLAQSKDNKLCFEKALFMSASDHAAICLPPVTWASNAVSLSLLQGCITNVEKWLLDNCGVILGICAGVAVIEVRSSGCFTIPPSIAV